MSASPRPGRRRALAALALALLAALIAAVSAPWWFDARRVATLALARADAATGLDWSFTGEPALRWRPQPWLSLPGLAARDALGRTVLSAERLELALPWSTLRGETQRIEAITVAGPAIDLVAALDWWRSLPPGDAALPVLDGLNVTDGRVDWASGRVDRITVSLPRFAVGEPMRVALSGRAQRTVGGDDRGATAAPGPTPFDLRATLEAKPQAGPLRLEALGVTLEGSGPVPTATARGRLQFSPWQFEATGELAAWPAAWPVLPSPLSGDEAPIAFGIEQSGESALTAEAVLTLRRDGASVDARLVPEALLAWLEDPDAPPLPPLDAVASLARIDIDGVRLDGIRVELDGAAEAAPVDGADGSRSGGRDAPGR